MSEFLDELWSRETIGEAFDLVYTRADEAVKVFRDLTEEQTGRKVDRNMSIPTTSLKFEFQGYVIDWPSGDYRDWAQVTAIATGQGFRSKQLFSRGVITGPGVEDRPYKIESKRSDEMGRGDFSFSKRAGEITVVLDSRGYGRGDIQQRGPEPFGHTVLPEEASLDMLADSTMARIGAVGQRIFDAVTASELIFDGNHPNDVLEILGMQQPAPSTTA